MSPVGHGHHHHRRRYPVRGGERQLRHPQGSWSPQALKRIARVDAGLSSVVVVALVIWAVVCVGRFAWRLVSDLSSLIVLGVFALGVAAIVFLQRLSEAWSRRRDDDCDMSWLDDRPPNPGPPNAGH